jgi:hypothetical protein
MRNQRKIDQQVQEMMGHRKTWVEGEMRQGFTTEPVSFIFAFVMSEYYCSE